MIFFDGNLKYDTDKMELISDKMIIFKLIHYQKEK